MTKLFIAIFVEKNADAGQQKKYDAQKRYMNPESAFALAGSAAVLLIWGLFPGSIMDRAAELGQSLMGLEEFGHAVNYFSPTNLFGGLISICIGVLVYLLVIRRFLIKGKCYINAWPSWLDLETLYRAVLLRLLPFVLGACCHVLDVLLETAVHILIPVGAFFARVADSLIDLSVLGLRKSVYRDSPLPHERAEGTFYTDALGSFLDWLQRVANRTWRRNRPSYAEHRHVLAAKHEERKENHMLIGRSLSFGLLLTVAGLCLTLLYILWP